MTPQKAVSPYRWNERAGRYINSAGRFVTRAEIRSALDGAIQSAQGTIRSLAEQLRTGQISLAEWQISMAQEIKSAHLASAAVARGGFAQLTQSDLGRAGQLIRRQYEYLGNFARQIERGEVVLDGRFLNRAALYGEAPRATYHVFDSLEQAQHGYEWEENVLNAAESCAECIAETERGRVPIGELIPIGARTCLANCKCDIVYFKDAA